MAAPPFAVAPYAPASVWRVPLVWAALAVTAGVVLDRYLAPPLSLTLSASVLALAAGVLLLALRREPAALAALLLAGVAVGAAYHQYRHDWYPADDVGNLAEAAPHFAELRGVVDEEPQYSDAAPHDPLRSLDRGAATQLVLRATQVRHNGAWVDVSGRLQVIAHGAPDELHVGDELEVVGQLSILPGPSNPGEFDYASLMREQGVRARLAVRKTADGMTRLERGWPEAAPGWLAVLRSWGQRSLGRTLPPRISGVAMALLLGEGSTMTHDDWDKYVRTGVVHVLAISGWHLVVLGLFLWWWLRLLRVRQRHGAWIVALLLLAYALLTGGHPPALRAALTVAAVAAGVVLRRRVLPANALALSWLAVTVVNPSDLFLAGCQMSFLSVALLYWGMRHGAAAAVDPLERLIEESRPAWVRALRGLGRIVYANYAVSLVVWLAVTPLAAARYHVVAPCGVVLGPPLMVLTSVALLAGFMQLAAAAVWEPLALPFVPVVRYCLTGCEGLVDLAERCPGSYFHVGAVPDWWLWLFYLALLLLLTQPALRVRWRWAAPVGLTWLCLGLVMASAHLPADELRCTFLAVGHGGCIVLETPDGRTLLYDAGALAGPECTRRQIAPFLWQRGIHRVDEVFLSHADLDHFNGLTALLERFPVGQVTCTPTFAEKDTEGVRVTLAELERRGIPVRVVSAGDRLTSGEVTLEVLHPPLAGPPGNENTRSLVLAVRHAGRTILLTGDLEGAGLQRVLGMPPRRVDVLLALTFMHGSNTLRKTHNPRGFLMNATNDVAYSYVRFSSPEQAAGDSLRRQTGGDASEWCKRNNVTLDTSITLRDLGVSAFKGAHRSDKAALGGFLKLVEAGKIAKGSYLIIENLDRLSREEERTALRLWMDLLDAGVNIVQLYPETIFRHERSDMFDIMRAVMELSRGHGESEIKSKRVGAAWQEKKRQARAGKHVLTNKLPAWIEQRDGKLYLIPERADVVRRIYHLAAAGYGSISIVKQLVKEKVPPMGRGDKWLRSYIALILVDRRPLGEYQPGDGNEKPDGEPIPNYFPACVTEAEWYAARGSIMQRRAKSGRVGKSVNLFAHLLKDARDGSSYFRRPPSPKRAHTVLMNNGYREGTAPCRSFPSDVFEEAVLSLLDEVNPAEVLHHDDNPDEVRTLTVELKHLRLRMQALEDELLKGDLASLAKALRLAESKEQQLVDRLGEANRRAAHPLRESWTQTQSLVGILKNSPDPNDTRLRLREVLRRIISEIRLLVVPRGHYRLAAVQVWFTGGERQRTYLVVHRPPRSNGKARVEGGWLAKSLAETTLLGDLDLRKKKYVAALEKRLEALPLEEFIGDGSQK